MTPREVVAESKNWDLESLAGVLAFSDWLEENGEPEWRYMVRVLLGLWHEPDTISGIRHWFLSVEYCQYNSLAWTTKADINGVVATWKSMYKEYDVYKK